MGDVVEPLRHDWQRIIADLKADYTLIHRRMLSDYKIGLMIGADANVITRLCENENAQPKHYEGERILEMSRQYSSKAALLDNSIKQT